MIKEAYIKTSCAFGLYHSHMTLLELQCLMFDVLARDYERSMAALKVGWSPGVLYNNYGTINQKHQQRVQQERC